MVGLIIGRFQPFHNGHLKMVQHVYMREGNVIIAIGSAQESHTLRDPFTAGERYEMIYRALKKGAVENFYIVPIEDINRNSVWVSHMESFLPHFDVIYTNNPLVQRLFSEKGFRVQDICLYKRNSLSGNEIRKLMIEENSEWKTYVPQPVSDFIEEIEGVGRMKDIAGSDEFED